MTTTPSAAALWARAAVVGVLASGLGIVGHASADGLLPGPAVLGGLVVGLLLLSVPLLAVPASRLRLVAMTTAGQAATHLLLTVTAGHHGDPASSARHGPAPGAARLPLVDGQRVGSLQDAYRVSGEASPPATAGEPTLPLGHLVQDLVGHAPMMAAHLAVAALVGLWLAHGERLLWTLVRTTAGHLLALVSPYVAPGGVSPARLGARPDLVGFLLRRCDGCAGSVSRRGPPVPA